MPCSSGLSAWKVASSAASPSRSAAALAGARARPPTTSALGRVQRGAHLRRVERTVAGEGGDLDEAGGDGEQRGQGAAWIGLGGGGELGEALGGAALAGGRAQVEEAAAADRAPRRHVAQDEAVEHGGGDRPVEDELDRAATARRDRVGERHDARAHLGGAGVEPGRGP